MAVSVTINVNNRVVNFLLRNRFGPVTRNMLSRGRRVQAAARRNVNSQTGNLARSINVSTVSTSDGANGVRVGSNLHYAKFVHDGTGIYGPSHRPIRPTRKKALAFGPYVVASSSGQPGTQFLLRALDAAG